MTYFVPGLPVTQGNALRAYVDGQDFGRDLYVDLLAARRFVMLTGLHFMADYRLVRGGGRHDADSAIGFVLASLAKRGVAVYLLVNQFWKDEYEVDWVTSPVRRKIMADGELKGYLPETYALFQMLAPYPSAYCRTDIHANSDVFATHHQKTVVIDDEIAYLGGIDLTYLDGDRWDTPAHATPPNRPNPRATDRTQKYWHDVHLRVQGPAVELVRDNFVQRWRWGHLHRVRRVTFTILGRELATLVGERDFQPPALPDFSAASSASFTYPTGQEDGSTPLVQVVRSMPRPVAMLRTEIYDRRLWDDARRRDATYARQKPRWNRIDRDWERSAKDAYLTGIRAARQYVYLENQWVADEHIWAELAAAAKRNRANPDFRIVVVVPFEGLFAAGLGANQELWIGAEMEAVRESSASELTFGAYSLSPYRLGQGTVTGQVYVHSKVLVVDDVWALIGSANAGGISLEGVRPDGDRPDTELSAVVLDRGVVSGLRQRLWSEHLEAPVAPAYAPAQADLFRERARELGHRVAFFPKFREGKRRKPPSLRVFQQQSRIVPAFVDRQGFGVPPTIVRAAFSVLVLPEPPPGWSVRYRWAVDVPFLRDASGREVVRGTRLRMRSVRDDEDDVFEYSTHAAAYIGARTAAVIEAQARPVVHGRVLCRVGLTPPGNRPGPHADSFLLELELDFLSAAHARAAHPDVK